MHKKEYAEQPDARDIPQCGDPKTLKDFSVATLVSISWESCSVRTSTIP